MHCLKIIRHLNDLAVAEFRKKKRKALRKLYLAQAANDDQGTAGVRTE
jgi:hypothetical protein